MRITLCLPTASSSSTFAYMFLTSYHCYPRLIPLTATESHHISKTKIQSKKCSLRKQFWNPKNPSKNLEEISEVVPVPADPLEIEKLVLVWGKPRQSPLAHEQWTTFLDAEGRVRDPTALKKRIFYGGVTHGLRKEVWPFLLGYYEYDSTYAEREYVRSMKKKEFETLKRQWQSISPEQAKRFTKFRERKSLIEKDVV